MSSFKKRKNRNKFSLNFRSVLFIFVLLVGLVGLALYIKTPKEYRAQANNSSVNNGFFFGSNYHPDVLDNEQMNAVMTASKNAKFGMLRGSDIFANIAVSEDPETWNWQIQDATVDKALAEGIAPMLVLAYNVPWLPANHLNPHETLANKNQFIKAFGDYAYLTADRYKGKVRYYNIWNEPSLTIFFGWGADEFARLFAEASYRIKEADPTAIVGFDVHALDHMYSYNVNIEQQTGSTFMPRVLSKMVTLQYNGETIAVIDYADLLMGHTYPDRTSDIPEDILSQRKEIKTPFADLHAYLTHTYVNTTGQKYGYGPVRGKKRYMLAENGWYACPTGLTPGNYVTEQKQAALIVRTLLNSLASPYIEGYLQYDLKDDGPTGACINTNGESEHFYGLTRYNLLPDGQLNPKPSYTAYKTTIDTLNNTNFVIQTNTVIDTSRKIVNYKFMSDDGKKTVWALVRANSAQPLKALDPTTSSVTLETSADSLIRVNMDGTTQVLYPVSGQISVAVSENPVLIVQNLSEAPSLTPIVATPTSSGTQPDPTSTPSTTPTAVLTPTPTAAQSQSSFIQVKISPAPVNGNVITGPVSIKAGPIDSYMNNTQKIRIYVNGGNPIKICDYATNSCSAWWNPSVGTYQIWATGYDKANPMNFTTSNILTVTR